MDKYHNKPQGFKVSYKKLPEERHPGLKNSGKEAKAKESQPFKPIDFIQVSGYISANCRLRPYEKRGAEFEKRMRTGLWKERKR